jgi:hypothetical protein
LSPGLDPGDIRVIHARADLLISKRVQIFKEQILMANIKRSKFPCQGSIGFAA